MERGNHGVYIDPKVHKTQYMCKKMVEHKVFVVDDVKENWGAVEMQLNLCLTSALDIREVSVLRSV
jgi:hypothetical protein